MIRNHHSINGLFWFDTRDSFHLISISSLEFYSVASQNTNSFLACTQDVRGTLKHWNTELSTGIQ